MKITFKRRKNPYFDDSPFKHRTGELVGTYEYNSVLTGDKGLHVLTPDGKLWSVGEQEITHIDGKEIQV